MRLFPSLLLALTLLASCGSKQLPELKEGDLVFQSTTSPQSNAIALATHSKFTHVGILLEHEGKLMVYEAVGPVKYTDWDQWLEHGGNRVVVRRLKDPSTLNAHLADLHKAATPFEGKRYDFAFNWSDVELYCSELVWKLYKQAAAIELNQPKPLKTFDLTSKEVKRVMQQRYGDNIPFDEPMISPQQVFESPLLETVYEQ